MNDDILISDTLLIGAGGTGALLAPPLARLLHHHPRVEIADTGNDTEFHQLIIADADTYEVERNSLRQPCGPLQEGVNKAEWICSLIKQQGLMAYPERRYADANLVDDFLLDSAYPLIITAVDNAATRSMVLSRIKRALICRPEMSFIFLSPGNADSEGIPEGEPGPIRGEVLLWAQRDGITAGIDPREVYPDLLEPTDEIPREGSCANHIPSAPQLLAANMLAAAHTLTLLTNLLDGTLHPGHCISFNGRSATTHAVYN
jgi:hypothetical protein